MDGYTIPEISLITSWYVSPTSNAESEDSLPKSLKDALESGVKVFDLYFLDCRDIPWYANIAKVPQDEIKDNPHAFVAQLNEDQIRDIANALRKRISETYGGSQVGRRPRIRALATNFPNASLPDNDDNEVLREEVICALQNTIYLASCLGCFCVEVVGGLGISGYSNESAFENFGEQDMPYKAYRQSRLDAFADTLKRVYDLKSTINGRKNPLKSICESPKNEDFKMFPRIAVELEPGEAFLFNELDVFCELREIIKGDALVEYATCLNVDIAHAFIIGYSVQDIKEQDLFELVAHMHISDHAGDSRGGGIHESDLIPGDVHFYEEYKDWLFFACELCRSNTFSRTIAVEMEACQNVSRAMRAIGVSRRWLERACEEYIAENGDQQMEKNSASLQGALLTVDIGNSTQNLIERLSVGSIADDIKSELDTLAEDLLENQDLDREDLKSYLTSKIEQMVSFKSTWFEDEELNKTVSEICTQVLMAGGSVMSFTGDGVIALFEEEHFPDQQKTTQAALGASLAICEAILTERPDPNEDRTDEISLRAALHWGRVTVPVTGKLQDQIIGGEVVYVARLCDWIKDVPERSTPPEWRLYEIAATEKFYNCLSDTKGWELWGEKPVMFKGLPDGLKVYRRIKQARSPILQGKVSPVIQEDS